MDADLEIDASVCTFFSECFRNDQIHIERYMANRMKRTLILTSDEDEWMKEIEDMLSSDEKVTPSAAERKQGR